MKLFAVFSLWAALYGPVLGQNLYNVDTYRQYMEKNLNPSYVAFYDGGTMALETLNDDVNAYSRYNFLPNTLVDVSTRNLSTNILGIPMSFPVGVSPSAAHMMACPEGENGTAKGAAAAGTLMILSTHSTVPLEQVAAAAPNGNHWFQLFVQKDWSVTQSLIQRAENAGYKALVITVDTPVFGISWANMAANFTFPSNMHLANLALTTPNGMDELSYAHSLVSSSLTWDGIAKIKAMTKLPLIIKGILTPKAAQMAVKAGASGIIVSNHGGRALDGTPATIDALGDIVKAVGQNITVMLDGGIRKGTDILKALALGAKAVFIGKPTIWGISYNCAEGLTNVLNILKKELDNVMATAGVTDVMSVDSSIVIKKSYFDTYSN